MLNNQNFLDPANINRLQAEVDLTTQNPNPPIFPVQASAAPTIFRARLTKVNISSSASPPEKSIISYDWVEVIPSRVGAAKVITWVETGLTSAGNSPAFPMPGDFNIRYSTSGDNTDHPIRDANVVTIQAVVTQSGTHYMILATPPAPFWVQLTKYATGSNQMGLEWREVIPNYKNGDNDLTWEFGTLTDKQLDLAYEANGFAVGFKSPGTCVAPGFGGDIVLLHPCIEKNGISYVFWHSEMASDNDADMTNMDTSTAEVDESQYVWDKHDGFSKDNGSTWAKRDGSNKLYDSVSVYIQTRSYIYDRARTDSPTGDSYQDSTCVPIFRLFKFDKQGHLLYIGPEEWND